MLALFIHAILTIYVFIVAYQTNSLLLCSGGVLMAAMCSYIAFQILRKKRQKALNHEEPVTGACIYMDALCRANQVDGCICQSN